jgi:lipopolysaccharide assembly outer membrane protein LptD (OstA)
MWDCYGLESLINVTINEQENIVAVLKEEKVRHSNPIQYMLLRARVNSQRHYEIYLFDSKMLDDEIEELFQSDTQTIVDVIREIGTVLFDGRDKSSKKKVIV